jgi:hypothetical protein
MEPDTTLIFPELEFFLIAVNAESFPITGFMPGPTDQFPDQAGQKEGEYKRKEQSVNKQHHTGNTLSEK